jgi:hypothetical protein
MGKNNKTSNSTSEVSLPSSSDAPVLDVIVEAPEVTEIPAATTEAGIVKAERVELSVVNNEAWMEQIPKAIRAQLTSMTAPEEGELAAMVEGLPSEFQANFNDLVERMNPVREGVVSARAEFRVPELKLYHGVGDDAARPQSAPVGSIYTSDGSVLAAWDKTQAKMLKIGQTFVGTVVAVQETRSWWRPRDKNFPLPPDVDPNSKAPICRSLDRARGTRYGACAACPHRPYVKGSYEPNGCQNDVRLYIVLRDFTGMYAMTVKGGSVKKAVVPILRTKGVPWSVWFDFGLAEERNEQGRWFSMTAQAHVDDDHPQGIPTTPEERNVLRALARTILHESYKPELEKIYRQQETSTPQSEEMADLDAVRASAEAAAAAAATDYSKNNL